MDLIQLHDIRDDSVMVLPTKGDRIKALQQEADACAAEMFRDMVANLARLERQIEEIRELGANYKTLTSAAEELAPQVQRWSQVAAAALSRRGG